MNLQVTNIKETCKCALCASYGTYYCTFQGLYCKTKISSFLCLCIMYFVFMFSFMYYVFYVKSIINLLYYCMLPR